MLALPLLTEMRFPDRQSGMELSRRGMGLHERLEYGGGGGRGAGGGGGQRWAGTAEVGRSVRRQGSAQ